ncbi:MAG: hypothetical protein DYH15_14335 [Nitrosomonas sp. PRO4]|nr:hypothetical protein [Nitrosomonas sp. PRO4]
MKQKELSEKLQNSQVFLFIGQNYLTLETGTDVFLSDILNKYNISVDGKPSYFSLFESVINENKGNTIGWMNSRCDRISSPEWLKTVSHFPWNGIYTSAIDTIWYKEFRTEWRTVTPIYDKKYNPPDIRSRTNLHGTFLFGSIGGDEQHIPPFTRRDWLRKKLESSPILAKLREIITPLGFLVIEGYSITNDWLPFEDFYPVIDSLNPGQVHFFSTQIDYRENEDFANLIQSGKIITHEESLASYLTVAAELGIIKLNEKPEDYGEHTITIQDKKVTIPLELWNQVSKSGLIIEDRLFEKLADSQDTRYANFLTFLHNSGTSPVWGGYSRDFAFQRNYEVKLWNALKLAIDKIEKVNEPIVLHGQSGTGKTIALGRLAYEARKTLGIPVLFIERRSTRPSLLDLEEFCKWGEDNGALETLIIWDGMESPDQYYQLLRYLLGRGRKTIICGSSYKIEKSDITSKKNFILAPNSIDEREKTHLSSFLKTIDANINFDKLLEKSKNDITFFVALYRLLPPTRSQLRKNLNAEVLNAEEKIIIKASKGGLIPSTTLGFALYQAGFRPENTSFEGIVQIIDNEEISLVKKLIGLVMVPGRFGLKVPLELLLRALQTDWTSSVTDYLENDIFRWEEDPLGQSYIGPRHSLEAQLIVNYRFGSAIAEIEFIKELLMETSDLDNVDTPDIQFAVDLLRSIGPNGRYWDYFAIHAERILEILLDLREKIGLTNSRILLQEASIIREAVIWHARKGMPFENSSKLLDRAEKVLRLALDILDPKNIRLKNVISVELGTLLATKTKQSLDQNQLDINTAKLFWQAKENILKAIVSNPEDYHPVDVLAWASLETLRKKLLNEKEKIEVQADLFHIFFSVEGDGYDPEQYKKFLERRLEVAQFFGNKDLSEKAFTELTSQGSKAGYYLHAMHLINRTLLAEEFSKEHIKHYEEAASYLETNRTSIIEDGRCLRLLLKAWWISKAQKPILSGERQTMPFSNEDWTYVWKLTNEILMTDEIYSTPLVRYINGMSLFQLGRVEESINVFRELEREAEFIQGRKRIIRSYLVSDSNGKPREFNGQVAWINDKGDRGQVFVEELRGRILFIPQDFYSGRELRKNDPLPKFHIAFNFIGPIADSTKHYSRK